MSALTVVKLGGSLAASAQLPRLLQELARLPGLVIAPGGGPFADAVRRAQAEHGFDDAAAHDMALLAMAQFGRMLAAQANFRAAWGADRIAAALARGHARNSARAPLVWLPDPATDAPEVERSWRITGDSLALWLAHRLGTRRLVLLKSCPIPTADLTALAAAGIVDEVFPKMARKCADVRVSVIDTTRTINLRDELDGCDRPIPTARECMQSLSVVS
ncbi:MAG: hypothetical protein DPW12_03585 [Rhodocyclaceae bacterium]|nr:hypothetical protein [Bacteroidia bacterium]MCQ3923275.1 hypothetical protein [Rhodocyclaceae bacterium]